MGPLNNKNFFNIEQVWKTISELNSIRGKVQKSSSSKAAGGLTPGAYGSVREDGKTLRTPLAAFFNIPIIHC